MTLPATARAAAFVLPLVWLAGCGPQPVAEKAPAQPPPVAETSAVAALASLPAPLDPAVLPEPEPQQTANPTAPPQPEPQKTQPPAGIHTPNPQVETSKFDEAVPASVLIGDVASSSKDFAKFPAKYSDGAEFGRKEAVDAFVKMADAAAKDGVKIRVVSGFRSFTRQKQIWEGKWTGATKVVGADLSKTIPDAKARAVKILEYSAMPTTSRHHWGTDFDINSTNPGDFTKGAGKKVYDWLTANADSYGFCQPYTAKGAARPTGYNEERWHWSYKPVATWYLARWAKDAGYDRIKGFKGAETARDIKVLEGYIEGVNPQCK
jgi:LAS superfamily LD-carboxypeptidase LdcB